MVTLNINGESHTVDASPDMPLLWVLRDLLGMNGTKFGCGVALCAACTVHLDGIPRRSCVMPISATAGHSITEWGHSGSGPAQLALAILADYLDDDQLAVQLHQDFKFRKIAGLQRDKAWSMSEDEVARESPRSRKTDGHDPHARGVIAFPLRTLAREGRMTVRESPTVRTQPQRQEYYGC